MIDFQSAGPGDDDDFRFQPKKNFPLTQSKWERERKKGN